MSITYAGQPLLLEDPDGELVEWLRRHMDLADLRLWGGRSIAEEDWTRGPRHRTDPYRVGLPLPNWPAPPRLKLNSLWWPTGATRWAVGLFLADTETVRAIEASLDNYRAAVLVLSEDAGQEEDSGAGEISCRMHLLPPRRLSAHYGGLGGQKLWLLTLVDPRYFWQQKSVSLEVTSTTTWEDLYDQLATALDVPISADGIDPAYQKPDPIEWARPEASAAALLDAAAWCTGQRIVYWPDGTLRAAGADSSWVLEEANYESPEHAQRVQAGGETYPVYLDPSQGALTGPEKVRVVFPRNLLSTSGETTWSVELTAAAAPFDGPIVDGTVKVFRDTALATFSGPAEPSPTNAAALSDLAFTIARDFYKHLAWSYDWCFAGLRSWLPTGYTDFLWWHFGHASEPRSGEPEYAAFTRVCSLPENVGVSEQLHLGRPERTPVRMAITRWTDGDPPEYPGPASAALVYPARFTHEPFTEEAGYDASDGWEEEDFIFVLQSAGGFIWPGTEIEVYYQDGQWYTDHESQILFVELTESLAPSGSADASVVREDGASTSWTLTVAAGHLLTASLPSGTRIAVKWAQGTGGGAWYFLATLTQGTPDTVGWFKASEGWTWEVGHEGEIGQCAGYDVDDIYGTTPGDAASAYVRATPNRDPNIQPGMILPYVLDGDGKRILGEGALDAKIGTLQWFHGTSPPLGWKRFSDVIAGAARRSLATYDPTSSASQYGMLDNQMGSHPIRPWPHTSAEHEDDSDNVWYTCPDTGTWLDTVWNIQTNTGTTYPAYADITVNTGGPTATDLASATGSGSVSGSTGAASPGGSLSSLLLSSESPATSAVAVTVNGTNLSASGTTDLAVTGLTIGNHSGSTNPESLTGSGNTELATTGLSIGSHSGSTGTQALSVNASGGSIDYAETGIVVDPHTDLQTQHSHFISWGGEDSIQGGYDMNYPIGTSVDGPGELGHNVVEPEIGGGTYGHTHGVSGLSFVVNPDPHSHTVALSHAGLIDEGLGHYHDIDSEHFAIPDHSHGVLFTHTITEPNAGAGHQHGFSSVTITHGAGDHSSPAHSHVVNSHTHDLLASTIAVDSHSHGAGSLTVYVTVDSHSHPIAAHSHVATDAGHAHNYDSVSVVGTLKHRQEDYRPPLIVEDLWIRVGPDDD